MYGSGRPADLSGRETSCSVVRKCLIVDRALDGNYRGLKGLNSDQKCDDCHAAASLTDKSMNGDAVLMGDCEKLDLDCFTDGCYCYD